jgi:hypothetical protein
MVILYKLSSPPQPYTQIPADTGYIFMVVAGARILILLQVSMHCFRRCRVQQIHANHAMQKSSAMQVNMAQAVEVHMPVPTLHSPASAKCTTAPYCDPEPPAKLLETGDTKRCTEWQTFK